MSAQYVGEDFKRSNVMASYVYERLCHPSSIRLIRYLSNDNPDEISLSLSEYQLDSAPDYQALSYVWGNPARNKSVVCNGYHFKVSSSLFTALQRIRTRSPNVPVWADAICINQLDYDERSQQVTIMGKIYRQATTVLVHIPNIEHDCSEVKALVNDIKGFIERSGGFENMKYLSADDPLLADKRWESAASFKLKPWFFRTWVIQEVGMARDPRVLYGNSEFSYRDWVLLENWALTYAPQLESLWKIPLGTIQKGSLDWFREDFSMQISFLDLFNVTCFLECSDARDHIYALLDHPLARIPGGTDHMIKPDYTKPVADVFYDFTVQMLQFPDGIRILSLVQHLERGPPIEYPSWVPFWNMSGHRARQQPMSTFGACPLHYYNVSSSLGDSYHVVTADRGLKLRGAVFDQLASAYQLNTKDIELTPVQNIACSNDGALDSIYPIVMDPNMPSPYGSNQNRCDAFSITLNAGFLSRVNGENMENITFHRQNFNKYWKARARKCQSTDEDADDGDALRFLADVIEWASHHTFFITRRGYVGLGPCFAKPGDICVIVQGGPVPLIIRRSEFDSKLRLVGECYIHGIMRGELASTVEENRMNVEEIVLH